MGTTGNTEHYPHLADKRGLSRPPPYNTGLSPSGTAVASEHFLIS
ncbi:MAG: hypothetical protein ACR2PR_10990 [Pseudohongiellaceae bacterium]